MADGVISEATLWWPTIGALRDHGRPCSPDEISRWVRAHVQFTPEQLALRHPHKRMRMIDYRLAWARTRLKKAHLVNNSNGKWFLTPLGEQLDEDELRDHVT